MPDIRHSIVIDAPMDRIRPLIGSATGLTAWWAEDVAEVPNSKSIELGFFNRATVYRLTPEPQADGARWRCDSGHEWSGTSLVFRLRAENNKTFVAFSHENWADQTPYFVSCNTVWGHLMFKLKAAAERDGPPRPLFTRSGMESSGVVAY